MGAIWFDQGRLISFLSEILGYKSGLALNRKKLTNMLIEQGSYHSIVKDNELSLTRVRAEDIENLVEHLLFQLGNTKERKSETVIDLMIKYSNVPEKCGMFKNIVNLFNELLDTDTPDIPVDPTQLILNVYQKYGIEGSNLLSEIIQAY